LLDRTGGGEPQPRIGGGKKKKSPSHQGASPSSSAGPDPAGPRPSLGPAPTPACSCQQPISLIEPEKSLGALQLNGATPRLRLELGVPCPPRAPPREGPPQAHCSDRAGKDLSLISGPAPVSLGSIRTHLQATDLTLQGLRLPNVYSTERCLAVSGPRLGWVSQPTTRARLLAAMATDPAPCRH
jgi:hypothetical protein